MAYVSVPKDLTKVKTKVAFNLTKRQLICFGSGAAIGNAVDERIQSERFKAELITNVSHDLKTPLTSIINYVDLLKKQDIDNPKAQEYIEVLDRKSQRLKKLTGKNIQGLKTKVSSV